MQIIETEMVVKIPVPEDMVLVSKVRLAELEKNDFVGKILTMKDFVERSGRSASWIKANILNNPKLIKQLDIENGGFVYYPRNKSDRWLFKASGLIDFIENDLGMYLKGA